MTVVRPIAHKDSSMHMKKDKGFTLIELMIALVLGLFVVGVTISVYLLSARGSSDTIKSARLNHDMEMVMNIMANDIRRAGYWGGAVIGSDAETNPFMAATTVLQRPTASCVLYTYDADRDGNVDDGTNDGISEGVDDTGDENEYYGFKLDGTTIRMRLTGSTTSDCTNGNWATGELVDSDRITITGLTFTLTPNCVNVTDDPISTSCSGTGDKIVEKRVLTINLRAQLADDSTVTKEMTTDIVIRNLRIFTGA